MIYVITYNPLTEFFVGAPQVLRHSIKPEIRVEKGENADLRVIVCADPRPRIMAWEWGSVRMEAGSAKGKISFCSFLLLLYK